MASTVKVILGTIAFGIFWVLAVFPSVPFLPIGRTAGSLLGAMLMVLFKVITPDQAYEAIDLPILGLLFATMVVSVYLEGADMFKYLSKLLSWKSKGAKDLICRVCVISAISSAFFTNDTVCVVLTEFVLKIAKQHNLPPDPFLLALATSANIGSAATPIGNPQNLVIALKSKILFVDFLFGVLPAMLVGIVVNALLLICMYWRVLSAQKDEQNATSEMFVVEEGVSLLSRRNSNASKEGINDVVCPKEEETAPLMTEGEENVTTKWTFCVYLVTIVMLVAMFMGFNMSWTAITAALALIVFDFKDARPCLETVSYSLLVFFCGMFIAVNGFNETGIPRSFWDMMEPYSRINHVSGIAVLAVVILLLSNLASNVPTVLLLGVKVAASAAAISSAHEKKAWLILAWVSTVAGNLSLLGSAANLIVCEQARRRGYNLSFWNHLKFGVPSTLIVTAIGLTLIR
ncbi:hypothetical protein SLE2022_402400 [Rubroshorea leprosula]